ncbi:MAG: hypothetical protein GX466_00690 [Candidatus Cloacimonetes bacterium]|jgi:hypothetical protein|nr:hypothetical protein [Candidatus Cloacimonadota bacterium]
MSFWKTLAKIGNAVIEEGMKQQSKQMRNGSRNSATGRMEVPTVGGRTFREWESKWQYVGYLDSIDLSPYSSYVGLYKAELDGKVMYVGRAVEYSNGGIRKRLSDYTRESDSARKHTSGRLMHAHAADLEIYVLLVGRDEEATEATRKLERYFIGKYSPEWNKMLK